jgi:glutamine cyclotransferase
MNTDPEGYGKASNHLPFGRVFGAFLFLGGLVMALAGCGGKPAESAAATATPPAANTPAVKLYTYKIVNTWPHDRSAFTEGLTYLNGTFLESTGLNGHSTLRRVDPTSGRVLQQVNLPAEIFGEGMTVLGDKVFQVSWRNQKGFIYRLGDFAPAGDFTYTGEGWGLTTDGQSLILSDGTNQIRFLDPLSFKVTRTIRVVTQNQPLPMLNELEWVKGELYANVWQTHFVARIDPVTGNVLGLVDFTGLLPPADYNSDTDVLNGIAYDPAGDRLFVTGKNWPKLFEVQLVPR